MLNYFINLIDIDMIRAIVIILIMITIIGVVGILDS